MIAYVLSERLSDADRGTIRIEEPVHGLRMYTLRAVARDGDGRAALAGLLGVVQQLVEHGCTRAEFDRAREYTLCEYENALARRAGMTSATLADALVASARTGAVMIDAAWGMAAVHRVLSRPTATTLDEMNASARAIFDQPGRVVFVVATTRAATIPTETAIAQVVDSVARTPTHIVTSQIAGASLVPMAPTPGRVDSIRALPAIRAQEWVLSNGAHLILVPTDFNPDQLLVEAIAPGGTSLAADSDYIDAMLATNIVNVGGLGELPRPLLERQLREAASSVNLVTFTSDLNEGVLVSATPRDAEAMFQILYLAFTAPRLDSAAVEQWRATARERLATGEADVAQKIHALLTRDAPRGRPITAAMIDSLDPVRALAFYRARFADASNFIFCDVGAFIPDSIRPLVERYIGGLPATYTRETWRDLGVRPIIGPYTVNAPVSPDAKTSVLLAITGPMSYDAPENMVLNALGQIARRRLLERLRAELHATYGVELTTSAARWPWPHYEIDIRFDAAPEQADSLAAAAIAVLDTLRASGPTAQ